jgi:hypothetical protein
MLLKGGRSEAKDGVAAMDRPKIFNVGFHKTGTSSMHAAFEILGLRSQHGIAINKPKPKAAQISLPLDNRKVMEIAVPRMMQADAFSDFPYPMLYRELDKQFPGSKFILTTREPGAWIKSVQRHYQFQSRKPDGVLEWIYGVPTVVGHDHRLLQIYHAHNAAVRTYFKDRPNDFLEVSIESLDFKPLCEFLNLPNPEQPFPVRNRGEDKEKNKRQKRAFLSRARVKIRKLVSKFYHTARQKSGFNGSRRTEN